MRVFPVFTATLLIGACTSSPPHDAIAFTVVDDFVATAQLVQTDRVDRLTPLDSWYALNDRYVVLNKRDADYLFYLQRRCIDVRQQQSVQMIEPDEKNIQRPWGRFLNCRIEAVYRLNKGQAAELYNLGNIPPSGNK